MKVAIAKTQAEYYKVVEICSNVYRNKVKDYGTAWRVLRPISVVDQLYIKIKRIQTIQHSQTQKISDHIHDEWIAAVNYAVIGLIQLELSENDNEDLSLEEAMKYYYQKIELAYQLMLNKNHDYGEAWREMAIDSLADMNMVKIYRMRQIIDLNQKTIMSEGLDANYYDILNYSIFALIKIHAHD